MLNTLFHYLNWNFSLVFLLCGVTNLVSMDEKCYVFCWNADTNAGWSQSGSYKWKCCISQNALYVNVVKFSMSTIIIIDIMDINLIQ